LTRSSKRLKLTAVDEKFRKETLKDIPLDQIDPFLDERGGASFLPVAAALSDPAQDHGKMFSDCNKVHIKSLDQKSWP
jgi:hypothetical protein